jgi:hypothetical protein
MRKLKKATNLLIMLGALLTALSGVVNTAIDLIDNFKNDDKKEVSAPVVEQRIQGAPVGIRMSKTLDMPASDARPVVPDAPVAAAVSVKTKHTLWWIIAAVGGALIASTCWYIHVKMHSHKSIKGVIKKS